MLKKLFSFPEGSFCYHDGKPLDEGITLIEKIEENVRITVSKINSTEIKARFMLKLSYPYGNDGTKYQYVIGNCKPSISIIFY